MLRRILVTGCLLALAVGGAVAGDMKKDAAGTDQGDMMAMHMAELAKCDVCKHMVPYMPTLGPVLTMDMARLNDGVAFLHGVSDPAMLDEYRKMSAEMDQAGQACMMLTDEEAETHLCEMCQGMRSAMKAGAKMSMGPTRMGDIMVLTSDDPAVQKELQDLGTKCEMILDMM